MGIQLEDEIGSIDRLEVWACHLPAVKAWDAVSTQWRLGPSGRVLGLDYAAAEAGLRLAGVSVDPETWSDLRLIERGAVEALNR